MATLTFAKKKTVAPVEEPVESQLSAVEDDEDSDEAKVKVLLDETGEMLPEVERAKEMIKAFDKKKKKRDALLQKLGDAKDDDDTFTIKGKKFQAEVGARGNSREIKDMQGVRKEMGDELFMELATVRLKDIDDYLTKPQADKLLDYGRSARGIDVSKIT